MLLLIPLFLPLFSPYLLYDSKLCYQFNSPTAPTIFAALLKVMFAQRDRGSMPRKPWVPWQACCVRSVDVFLERGPEGAHLPEGRTLHTSHATPETRDGISTEANVNQEAVFNLSNSCGTALFDTVWSVTEEEK